MLAAIKYIALTAIAQRNHCSGILHKRNGIICNEGEEPIVVKFYSPHLERWIAGYSHG